MIDNTWVTVEEILIGFALAIALGVVLAMLIRSSRTIERALYPWLVVSQMVPVPAVAPIFVIWTGFDLRPKVMVVALVAFFPIALGMVFVPRIRRLLRVTRIYVASRWHSGTTRTLSRRPAVACSAASRSQRAGNERQPLFFFFFFFPLVSGT